tara:strand:+ start:1699 stop:2613 length:915 start_codon:yes stop_codon:yes gene_type:complete
LAAELAACASADPQRTVLDTAPTTIVAFGDMPYRVRDIPAFEALLGRISARKPDVTIHVGDIKPSNWPCSEELFRIQRDYMNSVDGPLVFTPGDNEWTDCHVTKAGGHDPREHLSVLRTRFFPDARSLGRAPLLLERQSDLSKAHSQMVENARWRMNGIRFVTAHVVGSNNGLNRDVPGAVEEFEGRDAANVAWIEEGFAFARSEGAAAVVLAFQADPYQLLGVGGGFRGTLAAIAKGAKTFGGPILVVHGDSHVFTFDMPFQDGFGNILENVQPVQVPGALDIRALQIRIDPEARRMFDVSLF